MSWNAWSQKSGGHDWWDRGSDSDWWGKRGGSSWEGHSFDFGRDHHGKHGSFHGHFCSHSGGDADGPGYLELSIPRGDYDAYDENDSVRLMQDVDAAHKNFQIEAKFLSEPAQAYQYQGLLIEQDGNDWLRFDVYNDGTNLHIFGASTVDGDSTTEFDQIISSDDADYMRVTRNGDLWTFQYSSDGVHWTTAGTYSHELSVTSVGVFTGTTADPGEGPAYTAQVDYFKGTPGIVQSDDFDGSSLQAFWSLEGPAGDADVSGGDVGPTAGHPAGQFGWDMFDFHGCGGGHGPDAGAFFALFDHGNAPAADNGPTHFDASCPQPADDFGGFMLFGHIGDDGGFFS